MQPENDNYLLGSRPPPLMTAEEERERATRIVALRRGLWQQLVGHPASAAAAADQLATDPKVDPAVLRRLRRLSRNLTQKRPVRSSTIERLAEELDAFDTGGAHARGALDILHRRADADVAATVATLDRIAAALSEEKHRFVMANLGLVFKVAGRYKNRGLSLHDLVQEGSLGLIKAVDMFDPTRGFRFSTYAVWWIRHAIGRGVADRGRVVRVPVHLVSLYGKANRIRSQLRQQEGVEPTREQVAAACRVSQDRLALADRAMASGVVSLDRPRNEDGDVLEIADDDEYEVVDQHVTSERIDGAMDALDQMEADVVRKRFGLEREPMTLQEIGREYALSRERIRQIELKALQKMRRALALDAA